MVQKARFLIERQREAFSTAQKEKAAFSRNATKHILEHAGKDIPDIAINHPSKVLRLWLETFPDLAAKSLGEHATRVALHVEELGADPLVVRFDAES